MPLCKPESASEQLGRSVGLIRTNNALWYAVQFKGERRQLAPDVVARDYDASIGTGGHSCAPGCSAVRTICAVVDEARLKCPALTLVTLKERGGGGWAVAE